MITLRIHITPDGYEFTSSDNEIDFVIPDLCNLREKTLTYWLDRYGVTLHWRSLRESAQACGKSLKGEVLVTCNDRYLPKDFDFRVCGLCGGE